MLKLNASYSKKVPLPGQDYSSQSYHAAVEVELSDGLSPDELRQRIHETFSLVRDSVDRELSDPAQRAPQTAAAARPQPSRSRSEKSPRASAKQIGFLCDLAARQGVSGEALSRMVSEKYRCASVSDLSRRQASALIDEFSSGGRSRAA